MFLPTIIVRHSRENLKKCSLRGLEKREDFSFYSYPAGVEKLPDLTGYVVLAIDGPELSLADREAGLLLIDGTWRLAEKMVHNIPALQGVPVRSIPAGFQTAYPRRQNDCADPTRGLASIEALYIAYRILERDVEGLLDDYYWKDEFLRRNTYT